MNKKPSKRKQPSYQDYFDEINEDLDPTVLSPEDLKDLGVDYDSE